MPKLGFGLGFQAASNTTSPVILCDPLNNTAARLARQQGWYLALGQQLALGSSFCVSKIRDTPTLYSLVPSTRRPVLATKTEQEQAIKTVVPWSVLAFESKAFLVDQQHFDEVLAQENYQTFGSQPYGETLLQLGKQTRVPNSPLTLLRRLFLLEHTCTIVHYLENYEVAAAATKTGSTVPGAAFIDPEDLEESRANCFPYPMYDVTQWTICHFSVPSEWFQNISPHVLERERNFWETVLVPFVSTLRVLEGHCQSQSLERDLCHYDFETDTWTMDETAAAKPPHQKLCVDPRACALECNFAVPHSLVELAKNFPDGKIPTTCLVANGFAILATVLFRLEAIHRLIRIATEIDDRCLAHQAHLFLGSHEFLCAYMIETHTWTDRELTELKPVRPALEELRSRNPQSSAALAEYAGARAPFQETPEQSEPTFALFAFWPATFSGLTTLEESPDMTKAIPQAGRLHRQAPEHTALQNCDDPFVAFVRWLISKMEMFRSRTRGDDSIANDCINLHPILLSVLLYYFNVVQHGNLPGVLQRPGFLTRCRLTAGYHFYGPMSFDEIKRWVVQLHCFGKGQAGFQFQTRAGLQEIIVWFLRQIPALKRVLMADDHQGVMYLAWFRMVQEMGKQSRQRLEQIPLVRRSFKAQTEDVKLLILRYHDILIRRLCNLTIKTLNLFQNSGTFAEVCDALISEHFSSILSRVEIAFRTFNVDKESYQQTGRQNNARTAGVFKANGARTKTRRARRASRKTTVGCAV